MSRDRYKYFRIEAREILDGLAQGALAAEKGDVAAVGRMLRLAHTIKGAARVVGLAGIADEAHALEDQLGPFRDAALPTEQVAGVLAAVDRCLAALAAIDAPVADAPAAASSPPSPVAGAPAPAEPAKPAAVAPAPIEPPKPVAAPPRATDDEPIETVRVPLVELDGLLESLAAASVAVRGLRSRLAGAPPEALAAIDRAEAELDRAQEEARSLRLVPASRIFLALERAARDAATTLGKRLRFETEGGDVKLDGHVLSGVRDALMHAVRNAVDHGLEPEAERLAAGKPAVGEVRVRVAHAGGRVRFTCEDDGRGLDPAALRAAAVRRGRLDEGAAAALSDAAALELIFAAGFSTRDEVSTISGRGVGLDVVRDMARRLEGDLRLGGAPGKGLLLELTVPLSLAAMGVVAFEAGGHRYALPIDQVRRVVVAPGPGASFDDEGHEVPMVALAALARVPGAFARPEGLPAAVVVQANGERLAIGVDRLIGTEEVVVRPLPPALAGLALVTGAAFDADGVPCPVLDARALIARAGLGGATLAPAPTAPPLKPILVIDDSLTTRMLEQSILNSAGYDVDLAIHAEMGLEMAQAGDYGLIIVDVEMPGMSGYEFVALTRQDPVLGRIPAVLVTSLGSPADRARGEAAGASGYIVKGEFDQGGFLGTVERLLGRPRGGRS